ncbi:MAG: ATP-binding domain-containing protein, partial [Lachnospiraceae bacterium]|nr:ATP-binding domain-containing protein [Lachnospiraceae bacterium]
AIKGYEVEIPDKEFDVYDLAALAYLYKRIKEKEVISEAHHIVIDEAQDFGMMAYHVLKFCIYGCTYTVMGDVSQNIHFGFGLNDWEELKKLLLPDTMDSFGLLKKSYRNTVEISNFATDILHHGSFSVYPAEPIIRHGDPVRVKQILRRKELIREAAGICQSWQQKGLDTIAVICRDKQSAAATAKELSEYVELMESNLEKAVFGSGIMVLPVEYTKGLEFDAVLILDPTRQEYPIEDGHAKLLYVAATRALHELCVLHSGNLTGLIADPIPQRAVPAEPKEEILSGESAEAKQSGKATSKAPIFAGKVTEEAKIQDQEEKKSSGEPKRSKRPIAISRKAASFSIATPEDKKPYIARNIGKASDDFREETDKSEDLHLK